MKKSITISLKGIVILAVIAMCLSCNNPMNRKYNDKTLEEDARAIRDSKKITDDDRQLLGAYIIQEKFDGDKLEDLTYADILQKAKDYQLQQKLLEAKAEREEQEKTQRLNAAITFAFFDFKYVEQDYDNLFVYSVALKNKSGKDIKAVKGTLKITDLFGTEIESIDIVSDQGIAINQILDTKFSTHYNQFEENDKRLRSKTIKQIKYIWIPDKILFADGSSLE